MLNGCVTRLVSERPKLELSEVILMQVALLQFASQCYPGRLEYVNHCIGERCPRVLFCISHPFCFNLSHSAKKKKHPFEDSCGYHRQCV